MTNRRMHGTAAEEGANIMEDGNTVEEGVSFFDLL
jgi:hypothetical protein